LIKFNNTVSVKKTISGFSELIFSLALIIVLCASVFLKDFSILVSFLFLSSITPFFSLSNSNIYISCFSLNCIFSFVLAISFNLDHNDLFIGGGDDQLFYEYSIRTYKYGIDDFGVYTDTFNFKGYLFFYSFIISFLSFFSINDVSHFGLLFFNSSLMAISMIHLKEVGLIIFKKYNLIISNTTLFYVALFPFILFYSSVFLRDCWITFLFTWMTLVLIKKSPFFIKTLILASILIMAFYIRPASAVFLFVFVCINIFLKSSFFEKIFISIILVVVSFIIFENLKFLIKRESISEVYETYTILSSEQAESSSLGTFLIQSTNPLVKFFSILYLFLSPLPPPFFLTSNFHTFFISIGSIFWYFIFFTVLISFFKGYFKDETKLIPSFFITIAIASFAVIFSTNNPRHLQFIYPMFLLLFALLLKTQKRFILISIDIYLVAIPFCGFAYFLIKILIL